jgi:hypothetical protein
LHNQRGVALSSLTTEASLVRRLSNPEQEHHDGGDEQEREEQANEQEAGDGHHDEAYATDGIGQAHEVSPKSQVTR